MIFFILLEIYKNSYSIRTDFSSLTDFGKEILFLHKNRTNLYSSFGNIDLKSFPVPTGTTLVTQGEITENRALNWGGTLFTKDSFYFFSEFTIFTLEFIKSIVSIDIPSILNPRLYPYSYINITFINKDVILLNFNIYTENSLNNQKEINFTNEKIIRKKPFLYRNFNDYLSGSSSTYLEFYNNETIRIYEPFPSFCQSNIHKITTNCNITKILQKFKGYEFTISAKENQKCTYKYNYKCSFLRWDKYGQNPARGFLIGPNIIYSEDNEKCFSNHFYIKPPTPDFAMIFNTPIIVGFIFSSIFAIGIRHISKKQRIN